jgi:hypothetical protein
MLQEKESSCELGMVVIVSHVVAIIIIIYGSTALSWAFAAFSVP